MRCCSTSRRAPTWRWPTGPSSPARTCSTAARSSSAASSRASGSHVAPIEPRATARILGGRQADDLGLDPDAAPGQGGARERARRRAGAGARASPPTSAAASAARALAWRTCSSAWLARRTGRPVRWTETRSEHMVAMGHGRAQRLWFQLGGDRDGTFKALPCTLLQDSGAYPGIGAILPTLTAVMAPGVYDIPKIEVGFDAVVTNTTPDRRAARRRAARRPPQVLERAVDLFAAEIGLDPAEVRRRNFIAAARVPVHAPPPAPPTTSATTGARWTRRWRPPATTSCAPSRRAAARRATRGCSGSGCAYVEITNGDRSESGVRRGRDPRGRRPRPSRPAPSPHGQGHETTFAQIAAERELGIPVEKITVIKGDTDRVARGTGTYGSKSTQIGGAAARQAAEELVEKAKQLAAEQLEADPRDMVLDLGAPALPRHRRPQPSLDWAQLRQRLAPAGDSASWRRDRLQAGRGRRSRSARTSPSSRSTPRPARSRLSG